MRIIEIKTLNNGSHNNQTYHGVVPEGWAIIPKNFNTPNFPFGEIEVEKIDNVLTVTKWIAGEIPAPIEPVLTPTEQREKAYQTLQIIEWQGSLITVDQANKIYYNYFVENNPKADDIQILIIAAKSDIREMYPD